MGWPALDERGEKAGKWGKIGRRVGIGRRGRGGRHLDGKSWRRGERQGDVEQGVGALIGVRATESTLR